MSKLHISKPFGLRRGSWTVAEHNWKSCADLKSAIRLEDEGLVTITYVESHSHQYNRMCKTDYWSTYLVEPTEKGLEILDQWEAQHYMEDDHGL